MDQLPDRESLRRELGSFEAREKQIVGALFALMIAHPDRIRDREWISEQFVRVSAVHFEGGTDGAPEMGGVSLPPKLEEYTKAHASRVLNACFALFARVGEDLAEMEEADANAAITRALGYFE